MQNWFVVVGGPMTDNSKRLAYQSREHAEAVCKATSFDCPNTGPWRVIPLAEVQAEPLAEAA